MYVPSSEPALNAWKVSMPSFCGEGNTAWNTTPLSYIAFAGDVSSAQSMRHRQLNRMLILDLGVKPLKSPQPYWSYGKSPAIIRIIE